jgi:hypothetical protein
MEEQITPQDKPKEEKIKQDYSINIKIGWFLLILTLCILLGASISYAVLENLI